MTAPTRAALHRALQAHLDHGRSDLALDAALEALADAPDLGRRRYAWQAVRALVNRLPAAAWSFRRRRALPRGLEPEPARPTVGLLAFPTVQAGDSRTGPTDCFVEARVTAASGPADDLPEGLSPAVTRAIEDALVAVRRLEPDAGALAVRFLGPRDWSGPSCGLAVGLAALSRLRGVPVEGFWVASAQVQPDGCVGPVGSMEAKSALRAVARPRARMLVAVADAGTDDRRVGVADLQEAFAEASGSGRDDPQPALDAMTRAMKQGDWVGAARTAGALDGHPYLEPDELVLVKALLVAAANHSGRSDEARALEGDLLGCIDKAGSCKAALHALGNLAMSAVDRLDPETALALAERGIRLWPTRGEHLLYVQGPAAFAACLLGDFERAVSLRRDNVALCEETAPVHLPRSLGDLAQTLLRTGAAEEAVAVAERGLRVLDETVRWRAYRDVTRPFLHHHHARALAAVGRLEAARAANARAGRVPMLVPRIFVQLLDAELDGDRAAVEAAWARLPGWTQHNPMVCALVERTRARLGDTDAAQRLVQRFKLPLDALEEAGRRLPY